MKRSPLTLVTGLVVAAIFATMLFAFQVRRTEVVIVTTFAKYTASHAEPGLYFRLPWPIQTVHRFDNRIRNFERKYEQTTTRDGRTLMIEVFLGWQVAEPRLFLGNFGGDVAKAEQVLEGLLRDAKNSTVGQHPLSDFISTHENELKFDLIERQMLETVRTNAVKTYGVAVTLLGIKQLGLPESITAKVFERMKAEREEKVKQLKGEGEAEAIRIMSDADRQRNDILAKAEAEATVIKGEADAKTAELLRAFEQKPELAVFLLKLKALEAAAKEQLTLVLDPRTPPFDLLKGLPEAPVADKK